ncbi:MAG TPA: hypothetical protein VGB08_07275 [Allosphingosinicella sp.]|jgi:hypothetical protein
MRHEELGTGRDEYREIEIAAVWPHVYEAAVAAAPAERLDRPALPEPAVPDMPAAVGRLLIATYAALVCVLFAFMARSPLATFSILIAAGFVVIYFAVPRIFLAIERDPSRRPSFDQFVDSGIDTLTGRTGGKDALLQMLIVPALLTLGLGAMGIIGLVYI